MKVINISAEFVENKQVEIVTKNDGSIQIVFRGVDFIVYDNFKHALYLTTFTKESDDTLPCKDVLVDQLQYVDYIQKNKRGASVLTSKFKGGKK